MDSNVEIAEKGAAQAYRRLVEQDVMGNPLYSSLDKVKNSAATLQRDLNHTWNDHGAVSAIIINKI